MLKIKKLYSNSMVPVLGSEGAAGLDLHLHGSAMNIFPGATEILPTGIALAIPTGKVGIIKPRSGLAVRHSIDVMAGVIDSDYRGEVKVILINHGTGVVSFGPGDRIAQLVIVDHYNDCTVVENLEDTGRGDGGFGSTGK